MPCYFTAIRQHHGTRPRRSLPTIDLVHEQVVDDTGAIFEAPNGYSEALFNGNLDLEILTQGLGTSFRLVEPGFDIKRFPARVYMQNPIEAVLDLRQQHDLQADMVDHLTIQMRGRGHSGPLPLRGLDGKFSVEYCAVAALLDGQVGIETFTDQRRFSTDMQETLRKISVEPGDSKSSAVRATAQLKYGSTVDSDCHAFLGSAVNPMSRGERMAKVFDCVQRVLSQQDTERLLNLLEYLENVADISEVMEILGQLPRR